MLKAAYPAIKAADPGSKVLLGGLSGNDYDYLQAVYAAGGGNYFDIANVHPYTGVVDPTLCWNQAGTSKKAKDAFCGIEEIYKTMSANGHSGRELWLTEFGYSTCSSCEYGVTEAQQADYLGKALKQAETYPYVTKFFVYNFRNTYWLNENPSDWEAPTGLMRLKFTKKPAYAVFKAYVGAPNTPVTLIGDINNDGKVNLTDLSLLLGVWRKPDTAADFNQDGIVNLTDLSILLSNWAKSS